MSPQDLRARPAAAQRQRTAADIMTANPRTCSPFSTVLEATLIFRDEDCGAVPVVDEGKPVGIVTDRDVALAVPDYPDLADRPVSDIMSRDVVEVRPDDPLDVVKEKFGEQKVRRLLVIDPDDQLVGIIAWADLVPYLPREDVGELVAEVVQRSPES
jgi:CBS domain-containing protein